MVIGDTEERRKRSILLNLVSLVLSVAITENHRLGGCRRNKHIMQFLRLEIQASTDLVSGEDLFPGS